jgi:calcineurin-like phosphoesterase family protein
MITGASNTWREIMIYFTADLHFGHANIIKYCNRPFKSAAEMDSIITSNWNSVVMPDDEVYILGDFTMESEMAHRYLSRLVGRKYFIKGNHDKFLKDTSTHKHFEWVKDYHEFACEGQRFVLSHYPIAEWSGFFRGTIHCYGHVHNSDGSNKRLDRIFKGTRAFNVGTDLCDFKPVSIKEIIRRAEKLRI